MISQTAEYALRAVVCLAEGAGRSRVSLDLARATQVPPNYLLKVLQSLSRAGLVHSHRGMHGGFSLARSPGEITLYEVVQAVDPPRRIRARTVLHLPAGGRLCPLHQRLDDALAQVERSLKETLIADLLCAPPGGPLCASCVSGRPGVAARGRRKGRVP